MSTEPDTDLLILDGEVLDDVAQEALFEMVPAPVAQDQRPTLNLRRYPHWVSRATTNRRADLVYDAYMDGLTVREIAARSESILGVALGKTRIGQLKEIGEQRYDAQTKARRERGTDASEAKLDWAQRKATRVLTQMAELFSETGTVEMVAQAIAANPEMASEILMNVMNSGKSVIEGAKHFVDSEHLELYLQLCTAAGIGVYLWADGNWSSSYGFKVGESDLVLPDRHRA